MGCNAKSISTKERGSKENTFAPLLKVVSKIKTAKEGEKESNERKRTAKLDEKKKKEELGPLHVLTTNMDKNPLSSSFKAPRPEVT